MIMEDNDSSITPDPVDPEKSARNKMLDYENQILTSVVDEDGLVIMAKGLGLEKIFVNLLKTYCDTGNLVFVLGTSQKEERYFLDELDIEKVGCLPKIITTETNANERKLIYMQGGVIFVTTRILVVDMLKEIVPIELVTGILIYKAHLVEEAKLEAFILRLYRLKNKVGFIKAFSNNPINYSMGFLHLERSMRSLFVRNLYLWPRFHSTVKYSLDEKKPELLELQLALTSNMQSIQTALVDLISVCVREFKNCNPTLDTEELTPENTLSRLFDKMIHHQVEPISNTLSPKSHQLIADIKELRSLLGNLTDYDCVTFYNCLENTMGSERARSTSRWPYLDAATALHASAKERVYGPPSSKSSSKDGNSSLLLEENPKWRVLTETIKEIRDDFAKESSNGTGETILILAESDLTCQQIKQLLVKGGKEILTDNYNKYVAAKAEGSDLLESKEMPRRKKVKNSDVQETESIVEEVRCLFSGGVRTLVTRIKDNNDPFNLLRVLYDVRPSRIILYDCNMTCVRRIEVYQADHKDIDVRVYFLVYVSSTEEQRYLTSLRKETEAFQNLIKEKSTMVLPTEIDGKTEGHPDLMRDPRPANETTGTSSRRAGGQAEKQVTHKILVDMREFRSELPSLIHKRGIEVIPITLEIGDYILTPDICVERKSLSDLIGSLNSGRLYNQAENMIRHYKRPLLLIEFDRNKPFTLQSKYYVSNDVSPNELTSKLLLLTLHFPKLKIIWSPDPYATAEIFEDLKTNREQPDEENVLASTGDNDEMKFRALPQAVLSKLPGVNTKNRHAIMNRVPNLVSLAGMSQSAINGVIGNAANAKLLYEALHSKLESRTEESSKPGASSCWRRPKSKPFSKRK